MTYLGVRLTSSSGLQYADDDDEKNLKVKNRIFYGLTLRLQKYDICIYSFTCFIVLIITTPCCSRVGFSMLGTYNGVIFDVFVKRKYDDNQSLRSFS